MRREKNCAHSPPAIKAGAMVDAKFSQRIGAKASMIQNN